MQTELIGHADILQYLTQCAEQHTLSHAYSCIGPERIGRKKLITTFVSKLLNTQQLEAHPDIRILTPEKGTISIQTIRETRTWLQQTPLSGVHKILCIDGAHTLTTEAQNAFLKILEEPREHTHIFLIYNHKKQVLDTIYSRTVPLYFHPVPKKEYQEHVSATQPIHGRPGYALHEHTQEVATLVQALLNEKNVHERLRHWEQNAPEKENLPTWLQEALPYFEQHLIQTKNQSIAQALRTALDAYAHPVGHNWKHTTEQLILSI